VLPAAGIIDSPEPTLEEPGRDTDTVSYAMFKQSVSKKDTIDTSIDEFVKYSEKYRDVKLVLHWGLGQTFHSWAHLKTC
jgi:hypothetical protein